MRKGIMGYGLRMPAALLVLAMLLIVPGMMMPKVQAQQQEMDIVPPTEADMLEDDEIRLALETQLMRDERINAQNVDVEVDNGVASLSGTVDTILAKDRSRAIAEATRGVVAVVNNIVVDPVERTDQQIRTDVQQALITNPATESWEISVEVVNGAVTLTGTVESWTEKQLAGDVVRGIKGVTDIDNQISIDYVTNRPDAEIRNEIQQRMRNSVRIDDELIEVSVEDGEVTLDGTVGSVAEKRLAASKAWVAGVTAVESEGLEVKWWARDQLRGGEKYAERNDEEVVDAVNNALLYEPTVSSMNIEVDADDGVVTLSGAVESMQAKNSAERVARGTVGVWRVINNIRVRPEAELADEEIAEDVRQALEIDPVVERHEIDVSVMNGKVFLAGTVDSPYERNQAEQAAMTQPGVQDISNNLRVNYDWQPMVNDAAIREDVESELFWSPFVDEDEVNVRVENGHVTLTGEVETWYESQAATENAYEGGALSVDNNLQVEYGNRATETYYERPYNNPYYYGYSYDYW